MESERGESPGEYSPQRPMTRTICIVVTSLTYLLLARFSLLFVVQPEQIAGFWLPNGILVGAMISRARRDWGCLLASGAGANLLANLSVGNAFGLSVGFAVANSMESWLAAWGLVRSVSTPITLNRLKEVFGFVALSAVPACLCGSLLGAGVVTLAVPGTTFWSVSRVWFVADLLGLLLVMPLFVTWRTAGFMSVRLLPARRRVEVVVLLFLLVAVSLLVFQQSPNSFGSLFREPYIVLPLLVWGVLRFGAWGATTALFVTTLVAVWSAAHGLGPYARPGIPVSVQILAVQALSIAVVVTMLFMAAVQTERTQAKEQFELAIRGTDAGIWDWNLLTSEVYHSPRWKSMLGYKDHEVDSSFEAWERHVHPEDHSRVLAVFRDYLSGKVDHYEQEYRLRHKDGNYRWVLSRGLALRDASGRPVRVAGSNLDITAIKQAEEALRESERHFSAAFDDSPIGMDIIDLRGHFLRVNAAYCRMMGYTAEQLKGKHIREITHPDDLPRDEASMREFLSGQRRTYQTEKRYIRADGEIVWALLNVTVVADAENLPLHFVGQVQDITQLKRDDEELRRHAQELARSNQELNEFAYIASHDLKTPLRGIDNLSKWIADDAADTLPEASREHLRKLRQRVARLERLLDDLLQYSRANQQTGDMLPVQTGPLVRSVVELLHPPPGFVFSVADGMPLLITHKTPLELVFRNLIDNAIKHHDREEGRIEVSAASKGRFVEFTVRDDGPGIPAEYHARIFRMFQTLKPRDETDGSGIGLAVVTKVVERQGGQVRVESPDGRGTTFRFTWPNSSPIRGERRDTHA